MGTPSASIGIINGHNILDHASRRASYHDENDIFKYPMNKEAFKAFKTRGSLFDSKEKGIFHPAPVKFLNFRSLCFLAKEMDRQLTVDDLRLLFRDEGIHKCFVTKKSFHALSWAIPTKVTTQKLGKIIEQGRPLEEAFGVITVVGPFYLKDGVVCSVSGTPKDDNPQKSPLLRVYNAIGGRWGMSSARAKVEVKKARQEKAREKRIREESSRISSLGISIGDCWPTEDN